MIASPVIRKTAPTLPGLDFSRLRREGIERIIALGSDLWTDFNVHDPGITFLEVLCYAINDLSYRASLPVEDLLATRSGTRAPAGMPLATEVLVNNPVTALDWRKLLIDMDGVKNAWIEKSVSSPPAFHIAEDTGEIDFNGVPILHLNGLLRVLIDYDDDLPHDKQSRDRVRKAVERNLHSHRNLCEDLAEIAEIQEMGISLCANIEISEDSDPDEVYASIVYQIQDFLTPSPTFFGLEEMLVRKGTRSYDDIFEGPLLQNGFLDEADLLTSELRERINVSDLYHIVRQITGIERIWGLQIKSSSGGFQEQHLELNKKKALLLADQSGILLSRRGKPVAVNQELAAHYLEKLKTIHKPGSAKDRMAIDYPDARVHPELGKYFSIQNDLPHTYHVDEDGIERSESSDTRAKVRQLKGFLVFFDQILANYLAHLAQIRSLLGMEQGHENPTLFSQPLYDSVPDLDQVLIGLDEKTGKAKSYDDFLASGLESASDIHTRRNALLNHMLARFGETFADFALTQFFDDPRTGWTQEDYSVRVERNLEEKASFLKNVAALGGERGKGFNYKKLKSNGTPDVWDTNNVEAVKIRVCQLLGVKNYRRQTLTCEQQYEIETRQTGGKYIFLYKNKKTKIVLLEAVEQINSERIERSRKAVINAVGKIENYELFQTLEDNNDPIVPPADYSEATDFVLQKEKGSTYRLVITDNNKKIIARSYASFSKKAELKVFLEKLRDTGFNDDCANEGFHIVEHILLRPRVKDCCQNHPAIVLKNGDRLIEDPYSFWITVVVPSAWKRFSHTTNRTVFEQTFRAETPAHIGVRICWLSNDKMYEFESAYGRWLTELANSRPDLCSLDEYSKKLTEELNDLPCTSCCGDTIAPPELNCA